MVGATYLKMKRRGREAELIQSPGYGKSRPRLHLRVRAGPAQFRIAMSLFHLIPESHYSQLGFYDGCDECQCHPELSPEAPAFMHPFHHLKGSLDEPYKFKVEDP